MVEAGKDRLPAWLHFSPGLHVLKGVPGVKDAGQLYLEVLAKGTPTPQGPGSQATDVFSVFVAADTPAMSQGQPLKFSRPGTASGGGGGGSGPEVVRCKREQPETVATLVVDADLEALPAEGRLDLVAGFLRHMGLAEGAVKAVAVVTPPRGQGQGRALLQDDDAAALVTGTGDVTEPRFSGVALSWLVGCGKVSVLCVVKGGWGEWGGGG